MWAFLSVANLCSICLFVYICIAIGDPIIKRDSVEIPFYWFNCITFLHLSQAKTWIFIGICHGLLCFQYFQLYRGGQFYLWGKLEYPQKTTNLPQVTDKFYHNVTGEMNLPKCKHNQMTIDRYWIIDCIFVLVTLNNYGHIKK